MPRLRTILSIIRTVVYACLTVVLALWHREVKGIGDTVLVGAVCGDYLTWLIWSVIELPENLIHGCYEVCANTLFGLFIFRMGGSGLTSDVNADFLAVTFLVFLLVCGVKAFTLGVVFVEEEIDDDD